MKDLGLIQVYTGNGKGKTTASLGLAFRASGHGFKVCMLQFMKDCSDYGEVKAAQYLPGFVVIPVGRHDFVDLADPAPVDIELAGKGWEQAKKTIDSGEYDIVILDEINVAMACGLLPAADVAAFLTAEKRNVEIVLTGRYAPPEIIAIAHLVTEMQEVKHPYNDGVAARQGIDY
ncbi:cob(I)yrinic acid a,c-diamide adenosyltransferase [Anaeroselena agilis]|uniref:Cob(I)yrinic acid a,c-diamide adenosyltransferase n=1 Tax=Anaeroselena agilis TaxID=3063788 RepID=A0ABU3NY67_9FIRM|nr:cob(I)yrinic acid a,c-diamide adenosyltransferase [Selenomonadales bacterium 4137-cl]